jgi:outer membrane lipoprotein carrier protein
MFRLILGSLLLTIQFAAQAGAATDGEELLRHFANDVKTLSARFEQTLVDADDNVVEASAGSFELSRPGRFRWVYTEPYEQLLLADGVNVWSYDADLAQVTVKPQQEVLSNTPAVLLGGGGDVMADFRLVEAFVDRGIEWLRLVPQSEEGGFASVDLGFKDGILSRMIFIDALGQSTLIGLFDVTVNEAIDNSRFRFTPPADADLVGEPLPVPDTGS